MYNFILLILSFISQIYLTKSLFANATYVKVFDDINLYQEAMNNRTLNSGFVLIYSRYCPHCLIFSETYKKLSELLHSQLFFFALSHYSHYRKIFHTTGVPTIMFYSNGNFEEFKGRRSIKNLVNYIRSKVILNCTEISYDKMDDAKGELYQSDNRNLIIGYFDKNDTSINSFLSITNSYSNHYIDLCLYCTDCLNYTKFNSTNYIKSFN